MNIDDILKSGKLISLSGDALARRKTLQEYMGMCIAVQSINGGYYFGRISEVNGASFSLKSDDGTFQLHYSDLRALVV